MGRKAGGRGMRRGRFITMLPPPPSSEQIQKTRKLQDDISPSSAPLSTPHLLPPCHRQTEVGGWGGGEEGDDGKQNKIVKDLLLPLF